MTTPAAGRSRWSGVTSTVAPIEAHVKSAQSVVDLVKSVLIVLLIGYAFFFGRGALHTVLAEIQSGKSLISEATIGKDGVTLKLEQAKENIAAVINAQAKGEGKQDKPVAPGLENLLGALERTESALAEVPAAQKSGGDSAPLKKVEISTEKPTAWVYLGIEKDGKWNPNYFKLAGKPEVGLRTAAWTDVYKRDSKPTYLESAGDWKLGKITGVLHPQQSVTFTKLLPIEADNGGNNWWACIQ